MNVVQEVTYVNSPKTGTKETGDLLKGITILAVLINHYVDHFMTLYGGGIANIMVSIFFILSGYGISISLDKRLEKKFSLKNIFNFYQSRVVKIFPLLWIALLVQSWVTNQSYPISSFFGYELIGHYWFISAILQCYFLSPFLSLLLKKHNKYLAILFVTIFLIFSQFLGHKYHIFDSGFMFFHFSKSPYLHIYFIHTYLFFCGMFFQNLDSFDKIALANKFKLLKYRYINFLLLLYLALVYTFLEKHLLTSLPLMGSLVLLFIVCAYALENEISSVNLLTSAVTFIGNHSLPIYLFHMSFYFLLDKINLIETDSLKSMLIVVSLFPLFIIFSLSLEKFSTVVSNKFRKAIQASF